LEKGKKRTGKGKREKKERGGRRLHESVHLCHIHCIDGEKRRKRTHRIERRKGGGGKKKKKKRNLSAIVIRHIFVIPEGQRKIEKKYGRREEGREKKKGKGG